MNFDSYIVSDTKTSLSMPLACPPKKLKHSKGFKRFAFTLAETLITLTIIGVVAALTVPNLLNKYTKHTYVVGLKKAYAQLQHAMKMIPITEGCSAGDYDCAYNTTAHSEPNRLTELLSKQFKTTQICYTTDNSKPECAFLPRSGTAGFKTNDGMTFTTSSGWGNLSVDVNGEKGPNVYGRDKFFFEVLISSNHMYLADEDGHVGKIIPAGSMLGNDLFGDSAMMFGYWKYNLSSNNPLVGDRYACITKNIGNTSGGENCAGRVLEEDAMNY